MIFYLFTRVFKLIVYKKITKSFTTGNTTLILKKKKSLRKDKSGSSQHGIPASLKSSEDGRQDLTYYLLTNLERK